jgi:hypothetical protein
MFARIVKEHLTLYETKSLERSHAGSYFVSDGSIPHSHTSSLRFFCALFSEPNASKLNLSLRVTRFDSYTADLSEQKFQPTCDQKPVPAEIRAIFV